jgi:hypothetical protein
MLDENYFDDAFVLHDQTSHYLHWKKFISHIYKQNKLKKERKFLNSSYNKNSTHSSNDTRHMLHKKWANFKNFFNFQPINLIRNYFGESNALYFAWQGVFITTLWLPSIIGIAFFGAGLKLL